MKGKKIVSEKNLRQKNHYLKKSKHLIETKSQLDRGV
jgi:hypothetical protein